MICYECQQSSNRRDAVALCHHCYAGLCQQHALVLADPVTAQYPVCQTVVLPLRARLFLCSTCQTALQQTMGGLRTTLGQQSEPAISGHRHEDAL